MGDVIDFATRKKIKEDVKSSKLNVKQLLNFEQLESRNKANSQRIKEERKKTNQSVIKNYKIK